MRNKNTIKEIIKQIQTEQEQTRTEEEKKYICILKALKKIGGMQ